jgi:Acetyltransferase (GNAT) domain
VNAQWCEPDGVPDWPACTPFGTKAWALAWRRHVRTEPVIDFRLLRAGDGTCQSAVVPLCLVKASPAWGAFEAEAGVGDIWAGRPVVYGPSPYATYGLEAVSPAVIRTIVKHGVAWASEAGAAAAVFPGLRDARAWIDAAGGIAVRTTGSHQAAVHGSLSAFQGSIPASKARREFGRQWRRAHEAGLRLEVLHRGDMTEVLPAFTRLACAASARHDTSLYGIDVFRAVAELPGAVLLAAKDGARLAGGFLCLRHRSTLYLWAAGLDYDRAAELHTYGWLMAESVGYAAGTGATVVDGGRGNYLVKRRLGFSQVPLYAVCHLVSPDAELAQSLEEMGERIAAGAATVHATAVQ